MNSWDHIQRRMYHSMVHRWGRECRAVRIFFGQGSRQCPVCGSTVREYVAHGAPLRPSVLCPFCMSHERHRLDILMMEGLLRERRADGRFRLLHIAPEPGIRRYFQSFPEIDYLSADLCQEDVMEHFDLCAIPYPEASFGVIYCSHVLEHIPDDRRAIAELYRVLQPGGFALLNLPIYGEVTVEDPAAVSPEERRRLFGQEDHVRGPGLDYVERYRHAGFRVDLVDAAQRLEDAQKHRLGIVREKLYTILCFKDG